MSIDDRIGIDTHGYDNPPDERDLSPDEEMELDFIEEQISDLVDKYHSIVNSWPHISGYTKN
jgi:hypothetical protein